MGLTPHPSRDVLHERLSGIERIAEEGISLPPDTSELEKVMLRLVAETKHRSDLRGAG